MDASFLKRYLHSHIVTIVALGLCFLILVVSFALYQLPIEAVAYPMGLCAIGLSLYGIYDYNRSYQLHKQLQRIQENGIQLFTELPESKSEFYQDFCDLMSSFQQDVNQMDQSNKARYQDMVDYYTLWAHQIKTPIASMRLSLQEEDSALSRQLSMELSRVEQYVDMVMTYLRLDSHSTDYVFKKCLVDDMVKQSVRRFRSEFIHRKIRLDYSSISQSVMTDEKWFVFVLEQLLSNALKYTPSGTITIRMEGNTLEIADTGLGIAPEDLPRVFEKGYTGYHGREDKRASGLGLYLCKRICTKLCVDIRVESVLSEGTHVYLTFQPDALYLTKM